MDSNNKIIHKYDINTGKTIILTDSIELVFDSPLSKSVSSVPAVSTHPSLK